MEKTLIIAEVGINHNGDINIAKQLIEGAKWAGADIIKFQKRTIDLVYSKEELDKPRESPWGTTNRQQKEGLEFGKEEYDEIDRYCKEIDIPWFASPWDLESIDFIKQYNPPYWKIPSALITHEELFKKVAELGTYTFISTGMSTLGQIAYIIRWFDVHSCEYELMHCNSEYPADDKNLNLLCIKTLKDTFNCKIGYSGHEVGLISSIAAVVLGATSIERHITLNRSMYGSDQAASIEVQGFKRLVEYIRTVESALGMGIKCVQPGEEKIMAKLRRDRDYLRTL